MKTIFIKPGAGLPQMVIPDTTAHLNGHAILTYTYSVFRDTGAGNRLMSRSKEKPDSSQVQELIGHLSDIRDNPAFWNQLQDN